MVSLDHIAEELEIKQDDVKNLLKRIGGAYYFISCASHEEDFEPYFCCTNSDYEYLKEIIDKV